MFFIFVYYNFVTENLSNGIIEPYTPWPDYAFTGLLYFLIFDFIRHKLF